MPSVWKLQLSAWNTTLSLCYCDVYAFIAAFLRVFVDFFFSLTKYEIGHFFMRTFSYQWINNDTVKYIMWKMSSVSDTRFLCKAFFPAASTGMCLLVTFRICAFFPSKSKKSSLFYLGTGLQLTRIAQGTLVVDWSGNKCNQKPIFAQHFHRALIWHFTHNIWGRRTTKFV